jgi:hypothetical protein
VEIEEYKQAGGGDSQMVNTIFSFQEPEYFDIHSSSSQTGIGVQKSGHGLQMGARHQRQTGRLTVGRKLTSTSTS